MEPALRRKIEEFVESNIVTFHENRAANLDRLKLGDVLRAKNPYLFKAKHLESAPDLIKGLLDARLSSSEEGSFGKFMEDLAIFVASETGGGEKSEAPGLDIDLRRGGTRYLIAVKSGRSWGNSTQHAQLRTYFADAVKRLRQSKQTGDIQPTLGICYGKFKTVNNGKFLHIGGQSFWHLLSGDPDLYIDLIEPLGYRSKQFNDGFEERKNNTYNRMARDFTNKYCDADGAIDWKQVVQFVSKNLPE
jgi:type II restriction endonuclease EcoO109I-like protein